MRPSHGADRARGSTAETPSEKRAHAWLPAIHWPGNKPQEPAMPGSLTPELLHTAPVPPSGSGALLSATKVQALQHVRRRRMLWISGELLVCLVMLALLVLHSFRLSNDRDDNTYARWSSSWVMVLLSVLLVVFGFALFVTFYYFRTVLAWIRDPATSDQDVVYQRSRYARGIGWRLLGTARSQQPPAPQSVLPLSPGYAPGVGVRRHGAAVYQQARQSDVQRAWLPARSKGPRVWRQARAPAQQPHAQSSMSSVDSDAPPRRPPPAGRRHRDPAHTLSA
ncbi:hypothetical protein GGI07_001657 [Coemansia sp. Benny D115]|nr:hypothetical protein GGI07_001657 [Coemansia sp. Benny D115]